MVVAFFLFYVESHFVLRGTAVTLRVPCRACEAVRGAVEPRSLQRCIADLTAAESATSPGVGTSSYV